MVEFGLKLQDNQVSEWSEHYMDYEALKKILKKAKNVEKKYQDLRAKNPFDADLITASYNRGEESLVAASTNNTTTNPATTSPTAGDRSTTGDLSPISATADTTTTTTAAAAGGGGRHDRRYDNETSYLLLRPEQSSGISVSSDRGGNAATTIPRSGSNRSFTTTSIQRESSIHDALSTISDIFSMTSQQKNRIWYEKQVRNSLKERDDLVSAFDELFQKEQRKVVTFYYSQLAELEGRLEHVTDTVIHTFGNNTTYSSRTSSSVESGTGGGGAGASAGQGLDRSTTSGGVELSDLPSSLITPLTTSSVSPFHTRHGKQQRSLFSNKVEEWVKRLSGKTPSGGVVHGGTTKNGPGSRGGGGNNGNDDDDGDGTGGTGDIHKKKHRRRVTNIRVESLVDGEDFQLEDNGDDDDDDDNENRRSRRRRDEKRAAEADSIKRSLVSQYRTAKLLHNFAMMNITAFVKIVKKFDKTVPFQKGRFKGALESQNMLHDGKAVEALANKYETYYANWFCEGDLRAAKAQMLTKRGDGLDMDWSQLELGYRMGMCAVLAIWVCWDCIWGLVRDGHTTIGARAAFPVFRACGGLLLFQWFWGVSVFIWTRYRVNYIFLFDFVPSTVLTPLGIIAQAVDNTLMFLGLMLLYYKSGSHDMPQWIPSGGYPLALVFITTLKLIFPLKQRIPMWNAILKVVTAPFHSPIFFHTYIGDIFTSMVKIFQDVVWTICWVCAGDFLASEDSKLAFRHDWSKSHWYKQVLIPIITQIPLVIRFNQCLRKYHDTRDRFPHLANAFKYALSQLVTLFGTFHPLYLELMNKDSGERLPFYQIFWTILFVSSSLYSFTWDVFMDWGLGQRKYGFLGPALMYPRKYYYYATMAIDLVLRFMWVLTLVPPSSGASFAVPEYLSALTMMLELFRRTVWGFFRLENEHRSNLSGYRRVDFVPLHFNTGHQHMYQDKKERSGSTVLREVVLVAIVVGIFCFGSIAAAQHANQYTNTMKKEL